VSFDASPFTEDDFLPLSALQHLVFCERQCALIHIEQVWRDNPLTLEGSHLHGRTDEGAPRRECRGDLVIVRALPLRSFRLGLSGRADVVEFHRAAKGSPAKAEAGLAWSGPLAHLPGSWRPFPVEYKRGKPKADRCDEVQLCAQAMCLEEMLAVGVPAGALFYGAMQRRHEVQLDDGLRSETERAAARLRELIVSGVTPTVRRQPRCKRCSLLDVCMPGATGSRRSARAWLAEAMAHSAYEEADES
jgi:CRISPR-associated exonuclease Cas4